MCKLAKKLLVVASALVGAACLAHAQKHPAATEEPPELLSGGGPAASMAAVQRRLSYPLSARRARITGRVLVGFTVSVEGLVQHAHVVQGLRPDCNAAAVRAVRQLPRFRPGRQLGRAVACGYIVPVLFSQLPWQKQVKRAHRLP